MEINFTKTIIVQSFFPVKNYLSVHQVDYNFCAYILCDRVQDTKVLSPTESLGVDAIQTLQEGWKLIQIRFEFLLFSDKRRIQSIITQPSFSLSRTLGKQCRNMQTLQLISCRIHVVEFIMHF